MGRFLRLEFQVHSTRVVPSTPGMLTTISYAPVTARTITSTERSFGVRQVLGNRHSPLMISTGTALTCCKSMCRVLDLAISNTTVQAITAGNTRLRLDFPRPSLQHLPSAQHSGPRHRGGTIGPICPDRRGRSRSMVKHDRQRRYPHLRVGRQSLAARVSIASSW